MIYQTVEEWNRIHPIGTEVKYFPILGQDYHVKTKTRSIAWETCGSLVVCLAGRNGGYDLDHIEVIYE